MHRSAFVAVLAAAAGLASAAETINIGSFLQNDQVRNQNITGQLSGSGYNRVQVSVDWSAGSGGPWSNEAIWALTDNDINNAVVFYADPGSAPNSAGNGNAVTLQWDVLAPFAPFGNATPLWFLSLQTFAGSNANWNNVSATFSTFQAVQPSSFLNLGTVATDQDTFDIATFGSDFDTEIGLFDSFGALIANDDDGGVGLDSLLSGLQLPAGQYFLSVSGFNTNFNNSGFGAVPTATSAGGTIAGNVNGVALSGSVGTGGQQWYRFDVVPAPSALALFGLGGLAAARRRR